MLSSHILLSHFTGCKPEQQMMYAGSKNKLVQTVELTKVTFCISHVCIKHDVFHELYQQLSFVLDLYLGIRFKDLR